MENPTSAAGEKNEVEAVAKEVSVGLSEVDVRTAVDTVDINNDETNIVIKVSTAGSTQNGKKVDKVKSVSWAEPLADSQSSQSSDPENDTSYVCDFCKSPVKALEYCDICQKWACKVCVGVSSVKKMTTISALTQEAKGLFWCCDSCRIDIHIKDKEMDGIMKIDLVKEKINKLQGEEKVNVEGLVNQLEDRNKELQDKVTEIEALSNERTLLSAKIVELNAQNKDAAASKESVKDDTLSNTLEKVNKEKDVLLKKLKNAMSAINEEKNLNKNVKEECTHLKEDIHRNENQLVLLERKLNDMTLRNKKLDKDIDNKIAEVIQCKQEALKATELYNRELSRNTADNQNDLSMKQIQGYKEEIFNLRKNLTEADEKYALLYQSNLELTQEKEDEVQIQAHIQANEITIKNQAAIIHEQDKSLKGSTNMIDEQKREVIILKQKISEMEVRDGQAKALALRRSPVRINKVCQYYADPELTCQKRDQCSFEHPQLCRTLNCSGSCSKLHIEGLDFGKWKQQEIQSPFVMERKAKEVESRIDNDALRSVKRSMFKEPCRHYLKGLCTQGSSCRFRHDIPFASTGHAGPSIIKYNNSHNDSAEVEYNLVPPPVEPQAISMSTVNPQNTIPHTQVRFADLPQVRYIPQAERHIPAPIIDKKYPTYSPIDQVNLGLDNTSSQPIISSATSPLFAQARQQENTAHSTHIVNTSHNSQNVVNYSGLRQNMQVQDFVRPRECKETREPTVARDSPFSIRDIIRGSVRRVLAEEMENLKTELKNDLKK